MTNRTLTGPEADETGSLVAHAMPPRRPTMLDVARTAGVSKTTVSHVLNESRFVSEETRRQVLAAVETLRYRPDPLARGLRRRQTKTIGLLVPNANSPLIAAMLGELDALAARQGIGIVVAQSNHSPIRQREWLTILAAQRLDALLVWPVGDDGDELASLQQEGQPIIQLVSPHDRVPAPAVAIDFAAAGRIAMQHLTEHGYRRVTVLSGSRPTACQAVQGIYDFVSEAGSDCDLLVEQVDDRIEDAQRLAATVLREQARPDAVIALTATLLEATLSTLNDLEIAVPSELALIAMSDQQWLRFLRPSVTAVRHDSHGLAEAVIEIVRQVLARETLPTVRLRFGPKLVLGGSCGCESDRPVKARPC